MPIANSMPVPVSPKGMGKVGRTTFHPDGLGVRNVRLTRHILTVSTACRISETKIVCQPIRYSLRSPKRAARSSIRPSLSRNQYEQAAVVARGFGYLQFW